MDKRKRDKGLRIIAPEKQGSSKKDILALVEKNDVEYSVTMGGSGPHLSNGIPHAMVFDTSGKLIYHGHPMKDDFERNVKKALREVKDEKEAEDDIFTTSTLIPRRTWTNAEGKKIVASAREVKDEKVEFQLSNGRVVDYDMSKLSEEDQEILKKAVEKSAE